ncbi:FkbM family methyltransferase [Candidatus Gottesmanbacteria bacterium]|nr:FkbM family methyltransferase [Candidatus Gottesmanbacteria bacterium]
MKESLSYAKVRLHRVPYYIGSLFLLFSSLTFKSRLNLIVNLINPFRKTRLISFKKYHLSFWYRTILDLLVLKEVILDGEYTLPEVVLTRRDTVVVDIGAGFGDYAILMARRFPWVKVYAFEPDPMYFSLLQKNIRQNLVGSVYPFKQAVSSIPEIFKKAKISRIDVLKMDCEGCEFNIIKKGSSRMIKRVGKIVMEYHERGEHTKEKLSATLGRYFHHVIITSQKDVPHIGHIFAY